MNRITAFFKEPTNKPMGELRAYLPDGTIIGYYLYSPVHEEILHIFGNKLIPSLLYEFESLSDALTNTYIMVHYYDIYDCDENAKTLHEIYDLPIAIKNLIADNYNDELKVHSDFDNIDKESFKNYINLINRWKGWCYYD